MDLISTAVGWPILHYFCFGDEKNKRDKSKTYRLYCRVTVEEV